MLRECRVGINKPRRAGDQCSVGINAPWGSMLLWHLWQQRGGMARRVHHKIPCDIHVRLPGIPPRAARADTDNLMRGEWSAGRAMRLNGGTHLQPSVREGGKLPAH